MSDIFKSADWARDVERAKAEAAKPDGIIGSDKGLEYVKALFAEAAKVGEEMDRQADMSRQAAWRVRWLTREEVRAIWPDSSDDAEYVGTLQWGEHTVKGIKP